MKRCARCGTPRMFDTIGEKCPEMPDSISALENFHDWADAEEAETGPTERSNTMSNGNGNSSKQAKVERRIAQVEVALGKNANHEADDLLDYLKRTDRDLWNGVDLMHFQRKYFTPAVQRMNGPYPCRWCDREFDTPQGKGRHEASCDDRPTNRAKKEKAASPPPPPAPAPAPESVPAPSTPVRVDRAGIRTMLIDWGERYSAFQQETHPSLSKILGDLDTTVDMIVEACGREC